MKIYLSFLGVVNIVKIRSKCYALSRLDGSASKASEHIELSVSNKKHLTKIEFLEVKD